MGGGQGFLTGEGIDQATSLGGSSLAAIPAAVFASAITAVAAAAVALVDIRHTLFAVYGAASARGGREFDFSVTLARQLGDELKLRLPAIQPINSAGQIESPAAAVGCR